MYVLSIVVEVMTSTLPKGALGSVASLLSATLYQGNADMNHTLWNIVSSERYSNALISNFQIKFVLNNGRNKFSFSCPCGVRYFSTLES
jgi:hypothetical protein